MRQPCIAQVGTRGPPEARPPVRQPTFLAEDLNRPRRTIDEHHRAAGPTVDGDKLMQFVFRAVERGRRDAEHRAGRDGRQARPVPGAGRRRPADAGRAGPAHRHRRALRPRMAERPGRGRLRRLRPGQRPLHAAARAGRRADRRAARRTCPGSSRSRSARCSTRRGSPRRPQTGDGLRLARARPRRARGLRAVLPARLQRPPDRRVAARARRRRRQARSAAPRSPTSAAATARRRS